MSEFNQAVAEFVEFFDKPENYSVFNLPVPSWQERFDKLRETVLNAYGPDFNTLEEKTIGLRKEIAAWKRIQSLSKEEAEKELGYPMVGKFGSFSI